MSINGLLRQTISVKNPGGTLDRHGNPILGTTGDVRARVEKTTKTIINAQKEREPIDAIIFIGPDNPVDKGAQITYGGELYRVMRVDDMVGRNGSTHHYELMAQLWGYAS